MLQGTIIENSLSNPGVLKDLEVLRSWSAGSWNLHQVQLKREQAVQLGPHMKDGPWYMHFWEPGSDDVLVVFKDRIFNIRHSDKTTWEEAVSHGRSVGIPDEQLTFVVY